MPRFFVEPAAVADGTIILSGENAHHLSHSLRLALGDRVQVCDRTAVYLCELTAFDRETVTARILEASPITTEPPYAVDLYQALPKGDKLDTVIQKAVETGVTRIVPFESERCVVRNDPSKRDRLMERRNRIAK